jgi:heme-degrading monooxygenase HmoA
MEDSFVWITTRRIRPDSLEEFEQSWRPERYPAGMRHAYAYWTDDGQEVTGVSFWDSKESCDAWRASPEEGRRRAAMASHIVDEREAFFRGRQLALPKV